MTANSLNLINQCYNSIMKILSKVFVGGVLTLMSFASVFLARPAFGLTEEQSSMISQDCSTLQQSLRSLQRSDSQTRSYLGAIYKTFLTNFITPLNLNLIKNNQPSTTITRLYSDILDTRKEFADKFTDYSQSFEELLKIDCKEHPEDFYSELSKVRKKRAELNDDAKKIRRFLDEFYVATTKLKKGF